MFAILFLFGFELCVFSIILYSLIIHVAFGCFFFFIHILTFASNIIRSFSLHVTHLHALIVHTPNIIRKCVPFDLRFFCYFGCILLVCFWLGWVFFLNVFRIRICQTINTQWKQVKISTRKAQITISMSVCNIKVGVCLSVCLFVHIHFIAYLLLD